MNRIESAIEKAASAFVSEILGLLRGLELEDLVELRSMRRPGRRKLTSGTGVGYRKDGKRVRRSIETIKGEAKKIATVVGRSKDGMRAEEILEKSGLVRKELPRVISEALKMGLLKKTGQKRATTYRVR